jgi:hypothetical protein
MNFTYQMLAPLCKQRVRAVGNPGLAKFLLQIVKAKITGITDHLVCQI